MADISILEITRKCNLQCKHCYLPQKEVALKNELDFEALKIIISKIADAGIKQLNITGGEPFLYKKLPDLFAFLRKHNNKFKDISVIINTNGLLILEDKIKTLVLKNKDLISQFNLSFEAGNAKVHDKIRGKGTFKKTIDTLEFCKKESLSVMVSGTIGTYNMNHLDSVFSLMSRYELKSVGFGLYIPTIRDSHITDLTRNQVKQIGEYLMEQRESGWKVDTCSMPYMKFFSPGLEGECCNLFTKVFPINYKGELNVCFLENAPIGSLVEQNFDELFKKEKAHEILHPSELKSKVKGKCSTCSKFAECLGCRFIAYRKTGNYYASDPYCPYHFP